MRIKSMLLYSHWKRQAQMVFEQLIFLVGRIFNLGRSCGRYVLASLTETKEGSKCLVVLRVKPTPNRLPTTSLYSSMDNKPLHSIPSVCHPRGEVLLKALGGCPNERKHLLGVSRKDFK